MDTKKCLATLMVAIFLAAGLFTCAAPATAAETEKAAGAAVYPASEAYVKDGTMTFTVFAEHSGDYLLDFNGSTGSAETELSINGVPSGKVTLPSSGCSLPLHKGVNTIEFAYTDVVEELVINGAAPKAERGATTPYITYEAEDCKTDGVILEDSRTYHEIASEASGRRAVRLEKAGQSISLELQKDANALTLRTCVPDNAKGTGEDYTLTVNIGGDTVKANVTSRYTWVYGAFPYTNTPDSKTAHNFFDDMSLVLDKTYPAGTTVTITKDAKDTAEYYIVDLIETELVEKAFTQPENSLSITEYGAVANDGKDDTQAFTDCMDAAVKAGKEIWIPEGVFHFTESRIVIRKDGVTVRGAGMWHTVLTGDFAAFLVRANDTAFYDFKMDGTAVVRRDDVDPAAFETSSGINTQFNLRIQNVWIEHYKVGAWTYTISGVHLVGSRIRNTFADGINLCKASCNSMVEQNSFRGTGDDAVAMWSQTYADINNIARYNTIASPDLANGVAVYGGEDITVCDNLISDIVTEGAGIDTSTFFQPADFGETILIERNTLSRCGSLNDTTGSRIGAVWFNTVKDYDNPATVILRDNIIADSSYQGISFSGVGTIENVLIEKNLINGWGTWAIESTSSARGNAIARDNEITGEGEGKINTNNGKFFTLTADGMEVSDEEIRPKEEWSPPLIAGMATGLLIAAGIVGVTVFFKRKNSTKQAQVKEEQQ